MSQRHTKSLLYSRKKDVLEINTEKSKNEVSVLLGYDTVSFDVMIGVRPFETAEWTHFQELKNPRRILFENSAAK
jgi:uncharacterized Zn finger protein